MNRLEQKCVVASAGLHLLLVAILFIGPAFLAHKSEPDNLPILDFIPIKTVDALISGGGSPTGRLPEPPPPAPPARPVTPPVREPAPLPEPPKPAPPEVVSHPTPESSLVPSTSRKPKLPDVSLKPVTRPKPTRTDDTAARDAERAKELADARRHRMADALGKAAGHLDSAIASSTSIELKGPGGGGVPYANFLQAVKSRYANAWTVPDGVTDDEATTVASVTIARDGKVVSHRIIRSSGSMAVDQSVQEVLERVKYAAPLPDDAKEDQRTVSINFNVKAKKALG